MKKAIIGYGGFASEIRDSIKHSENIVIDVFFVSDEYYNGENKTRPLSDFNPNEYEVIVAIANPRVREKIIKKLPKETKYYTHINKSAQILGDDVVIGEGSIICAGTIITTNIKLGKHTQLNLQTTIGHDSEVGDYFTTAPGVRISGNSIIGDCVYFGTNSSNKEKTKICDDAVIGLNCGVINDITKPGTYVGTPAKKIK
jgi:sugar O-acyltransferase (sialic acid O-acetyltransferase NeuD family)